MRGRTAWMAGLGMMALVVPVAADAQAPAAPPAVTVQTAPQAAAPAKEALPAYLKVPSIQHSVLKATTFRVATTIAQTAVLSAATGSVAAGTVLAMFDSTKSALLYAINDYAWDSFAPVEPPAVADSQFDIAGSFWRNTGEFLTFKPADAGLRFVGFYLFTGSGATALAWNGLSTFATTAAFFVNNVLWDFYEWSARRNPT